MGPENAHDPSSQEQPRPGKPIDAGRLLLQLLRRRWLILAAAVLGVAGGVFVAKALVPRTYESQTAFVWEPDEITEVRDLRTRVDSVTLPTRLEEVRQRLGIDAQLDDLAERIELKYDAASNLVTVQASATTARGAQRLADTVVDVFLDHQSELERTRREERVQALREDLERARKELEASRAEYDAFREKHGITDLSAQRKRAIERAADLRTQADMAQADMRASSDGAGATPVASPRLKEARRKLEKARVRYSDRHPKVEALEAEVRSLESGQATGEQLAVARRRAFEDRRERFEKVNAQATKRLEQLNEVEGRASQLLASVRTDENHVSEVQGKLADARDAANDPQSGFRVVAPALVPSEPTSSWRKPVAIGIPVAAVTLVVLFILVAEIRGLRLRTASEIAYWGHAAVVGSSTWPRDENALPLFVEEMGQDAVHATGRTLVMAASDDEIDAADELAAGLERTLMLSAPRPPVEAVDAPVDLAGEEYGGPEEAWHMPPPAGSGPPSEPGSASAGTALARRPFDRSDRGAGLARHDEPAVELCVGRRDGHQLRRATRRADRVLVVVRSGAVTIPQIIRMRARLGRDDPGVAFAVVGLADHLVSLADRAGPVEQFWTTQRM